MHFNAAVNAHFAPDSTYEGRSLKIHGASQLKRPPCSSTRSTSAALPRSPTRISMGRRRLHAIVKRDAQRPSARLSAFEFAVPTRITLTFRADDADEDAKGALHCTHWHDEWPLESLITRLPLSRQPVQPARRAPPHRRVRLGQQRRLLAPIEALDDQHKHVHRASHAYRQQVRPHLPRSLVQGFDAGVNAAENVGQHAAGLISRASYGPLKAVEELARTATVVANLALPEQLQLPYPSVFAQPAAARQLARLRSQWKKARRCERQRRGQSQRSPCCGCTL